MNHFIYILQLLPPFDKQENWTASTHTTLENHWNYLVGLHKKGIMKVVGRTELPLDHKQNRGIAIFTAASFEEALKIMENDPCLKDGVMQGQVHPFNFAFGCS